MSLFGGSSIATSPSSSSDVTLPTPTAPESPPNAQTAGDAYDRRSPYLDSELEDIDLYDPDDADTDTASEGDVRPNRFRGKASTWRGHTENERLLANSLNDIESGDLAAQLYNAQALKKRTRIPAEQLAQLPNWRSKDKWLKKGEALRFTDSFGETQTELIPPKTWTAWPLPPSAVPEPAERFGRGEFEGEDDEWKIGSLKEQNASDELKEEILALMLRQARVQWEARESGDDTQDETEESTQRRGRSTSEVSGRTQSLGRGPEEALSGVDTSMHDVPESKADGSNDPADDDETKFARILGKRKYSRPQQPKSAKPTVMSDDDRARRLLQPTVSSVLTHVDELASAIRRSRLNHLGRGASSDASGSGMTSDAENPRTDRRYRHDSDSASDYGAEHESGPASSSSSSDSKSSNATSSKRNKAPQTGLMDWSEILGIASMIGWDKEAVARAAQRCATLFGESMSTRAFAENTTSQAIAEVVHYAPSSIPGSAATSPTDPPSKRPYFEKGTLRCPHTDCWGHEKEFQIPYRVVEHIQRVHGYDPRINNSDNEERKHGGVHIDGFLQPIYAKQGWLGSGRSKSADSRGGRRSKRVKTESQAGSPARSQGSVD
ncbi:hypothetical protein EJ04DRAFT_428980 [Polyplosphaeria fusca]|uniref:Rrn9 domain-containing protein n=1 Tax=Polyplosphaeria fusca TaxID=682080 RepID=A0A9P4R852_9PLEO|nr:hypothetical protein EJ04DRAFT_428980 [Polyplosphaeria fusca]